MLRFFGIALTLVVPCQAAAQELLQAMPLSVASVPDEPLLGQPYPALEPLAVEPAVPIDPLGLSGGAWTWQVLPTGIIYQSYLAGPSEPRFGSQWFHDRGGDDFWDITLGGRAGLVRYGTADPMWPEGWQLDVEGAAFPRLTLDHDRDLVSSDFRAGFPLTYRQGVWETKFTYYHLSSHLGDENMLKHPELEQERINYSRDALAFGLALRPDRDWRLYAEAGWAFYEDGGSEPWEFQFGASYAPGYPTGFRGAPFAAVHGHLRQENDFGGNVTVQAGWAWRGQTSSLFRIGLHYLNGKSPQRQFFRESEQQIGLGMWYDY
jgi:hypothetical protein